MKHTYEYVKQVIEQEGYILLSTEYLDNKHKLDIQCPHGHIFNMSLFHFKDQHHRCPICSGKKKKTLEEVKRVIEQEGYKLHSTEYINKNNKLQLECSEGHKFDMTFSCFNNQGHRCSACSGKKKKTIEEIKQSIESEQGYKLLSTEYKNAFTKLSICCPEGHVFEMRPNNFKSGQRCPVCFGTPKKTIEEVRKIVDEAGYKLLSTEYNGCFDKLKFQCPRGHVYHAQWNSFRDGFRCAECAGVKKHTFEETKTLIESEQGYKLLSTKYKNATSNLDVMCDKGHIHKTSYARFQQGYRCPICAIDNTRLSYDEVKNYIESFNYKLISNTYINSYTKISIECDRGHKFDMRFNCFKNSGHRCPECVRQKTTSKGEKEVLSFVKEIYSDIIIENDRSVVRSPLTDRMLELDIYLPNINNQ